MKPGNSKTSIKSIFSDGRLLGYNSLLLLISPYILWRKARRARSRRTPHEFDWQRWTCEVKPEYRHADGAHVVLFCTGVGELRIAAELSKLLRSERGNLNVTWAIRRRDVADLARLQYPRQSIVPMPFDFFWPCRTWMHVVKPDLLVGIERLWWPNLFWHARLNGIPAIVVAATHLARIKVSLWDGISRWTLQALNQICLQNENEREKLAPFLPDDRNAERVRILGALKWFEEGKSEVEKPNSLQSWLGDGKRPLLLAGSTHSDEEQFVLLAFEAARKESDCVLVIAPRQLHRSDEIEKLCCDAGFKVKRRSQSESEDSDIVHPDVYLLDTMGELASAYQYARAAFVGGTLRGAGHNVLEPLAFGVPVAFGVGGEKSRPTTTQSELMEAGLGKRVATPEALATYWKEVLLNTDFSRQIRERLEKFRQTQVKAWHDNVAAIIELIPQK